MFSYIKPSLISVQSTDDRNLDLKGQTWRCNSEMRLKQTHAPLPTTMLKNSSRVNYTLSNHNQTQLTAIMSTMTTTPATATATPPSCTASTCVPCSFFSLNPWMLSHLYLSTLSQRRNHHLSVMMTHLLSPLPLLMMWPLSPQPESATNSKL